MLFIFGALFVGLIISIGPQSWNIMVPFGLAFGVILLAVIFSTTSKTIITDDEISTQNLFGKKTLRWNEINHISGWGYAIKLQDMDRYLTVVPSPQLPGYPEIIEWIGVKRPDLFNPLEYSEMSRSFGTTAILPMVGLGMIGLGGFAYTQAQDTFFPFIILVIIGLGFIAMTFTTAQSVAIQGSSIAIRYLLQQKSLSANDVSSVGLRFTQTRNGKNYFIVLNLVDRKIIRLSGLKPNLPTAYLVLKNWHGNNNKIRPIGQN
jgi:hypothetical protein